MIAYGVRLQMTKEYIMQRIKWHEEEIIKRELREIANK